MHDLLRADDARYHSNSIDGHHLLTDIKAAIEHTLCQAFGEHSLVLFLGLDSNVLTLGLIQGRDQGLCFVQLSLHLEKL